LLRFARQGELTEVLRKDVKHVSARAQGGRFEEKGKIIDISSEYAFRTICECTAKAFSRDASVLLQVKGTTYARLEHPGGEYEYQYPYCYPVAGGVIFRNNVSYAGIAGQLIRYGPDVLDMLFTVLIRMMKQREVANGISGLDILTSSGYSLGNQAGGWPLLSLLCTLIGAAACETGRGGMGYVNVRAAYQHLKHDMRRLWEAWPRLVTRDEFDRELWRYQTVTGWKKARIQEVFPSTYEVSGTEPKRNGFGFSGSQSMIRDASGKPANVSYVDEAFRKAYPAWTDRDLRLFADWKPKSYMFHKSHRPPINDTDQRARFERKILHHLRAIFTVPTTTATGTIQTNPLKRKNNVLHAGSLQPGTPTTPYQTKKVLLSPPTCTNPQCGRISMQLIEKGPYGPFWGCPNYFHHNPEKRCRYTKKCK